MTLMSLPYFQEDFGAFEHNVTKITIVVCISMFSSEMFATGISNAIHILFSKISDKHLTMLCLECTAFIEMDLENEMNIFI